MHGIDRNATGAVRMCALFLLSLAGCATVAQPSSETSSPRGMFSSEVPLGDWVGDYTGEGDFYERDQGWSRERRANVSVTMPPTGTGGTVTVHGILLSEDLRHYGLTLELPKPSGSELGGSRTYQGETVVYQFNLAGERLDGRMSLYDGPLDGHPRAIYAFRVSKSRLKGAAGP